MAVIGYGYDGWDLTFADGATLGDGRWYLSVADLSEGGVMRLESWSLTMKGLAAVPEPGMWGCVVGLGLGVWGWVRRSR